MGESEEDKKLRQSPDKTDSDIDETSDAVHWQADESEASSGTAETDSADPVEVDNLPAAEKGSDSQAPASDARNDDIEFDADDATSDQGKPPIPVSKPARPGRPWFGFFNLLLIIGIVAAAYYYWDQEQTSKQQLEQRLASMQQLLDTKLSRVDLSSLVEADQIAESARSSIASEVESLSEGQQVLNEASEKLFELYGRDRNDWQLAEVEYLMRIAQHKLTLEDDFEGAAMTLRAASDKIAEAADTGLLPVRVKISEEIAELKTRKRVDLVGISLMLTEMERQLVKLKPGFAVVAPVEATEQGQPVEKPWLQSSPTEVLDRLGRFVDSLVRVRYENTAPSVTEANQMDVGESLRDWLKLARWAVLDRNEKQYVELLERAEQLFVGFYSQDKDENRDFLRQLSELKSRGLSSDKPDISGSLFLMRKILQQRAELESSGVTQ